MQALFIQNKQTTIQWNPLAQTFMSPGAQVFTLLNAAALRLCENSRDSPLRVRSQDFNFSTPSSNYFINFSTNPFGNDAKRAPTML